MDDPKRARSRKRLIRPRVSLQNVAPVLYSTPNRPLIVLGDQGLVGAPKRIKGIIAH